MPGIERTLSRARSAASALSTARPLPLLAALCCVQIALGAWVAFHAPHNGWLWYSGGDATEYWTSSWWLSRGALGQTLIGYGVPVLWMWVPLVTGTTLLAGLPVIVALQFIFLVPLALVLFFLVADRLFGRLFAWWATALWILGPLLMLIGFSPSYAPKFRAMFLAPHWFGLTNMADLPSLVAVLASAWAALRLIDRQAVEDGILTGLFAGAALGIKPANAFFVPGLLLLVAAVRRLRPLVATAIAIMPALLTLALWKERGRGTVPILAGGSHREAAAGPVASVAVNHYVHFDWGQFHRELMDLREVFWNYRLLEFLAVAGALAVVRRDRLKGAFIVLWFAAFCIVKGSSETSSIVSVSYFRFVFPGLPAFVLMVAALVYFVPRRRAPFAQPGAATSVRGGRRTIVVAALLLAAVPLAVVAFAAPTTHPIYAWVPAIANDAPLSNALAMEVHDAGGGAVALRWDAPSAHGAKTYYVVYRSSTGDGCAYPPAGAVECDLTMDVAAMTRDTTLVDRPGPGRHWYRVAMMANYRDALDGSDLMLIGPATAARPAAR